MRLLTLTQTLSTMAHLISNHVKEEPKLSKEQLIEYLITTDKTPLLLKRIYLLYAIFESNIKIPITNKTKARYTVISYIPLNDPMFQSDKIIDHIYPTKIGSYVQFIFEGYSDNNGIGRSWIE